jgi:Domain of unknown function DUF29
LQHAWAELLSWAYPKARHLAATETGLPRATFPDTCPWGVDELLDDDFWPEEG